jgi:hypothetical protein
MRLILLLLLFLVPAFSDAQIPVANPLGPQTSLVLFPSYPSPGQDFTVTLDDYSGGSFGASISWFVNGAELPDSKNARSITLNAGAAGTSQRIEALLAVPNGPSQRVVASITPRYLDIIFEPQTHVPSFYKGRSLPSQGSVVNATALLHGTTLSTNDLVYTWQVGSAVINGGPLRGQNKISFTTPPGREIIVSLQVTNNAGEVLAKRTLSLPSVDPELLYYEVNTLYGVMPRSLSTLLLISNSATIRAVPYYLDSRVYNQPDVSVWEIDGDEYNSGTSNPYEITIQRVNFGGSSELEFHVRSTTNFLQGARSGLMINY